MGPPSPSPRIALHLQTEDRSLSVEELVPRLRPVLVWLHGGNFQHGSGTFDDVGPERFMDNEEDVVLVVPNYRLNALGTAGWRWSLLQVGCHNVVALICYAADRIPECRRAPCRRQRGHEGRLHGPVLGARQHPAVRWPPGPHHPGRLAGGRRRGAPPRPQPAQLGGAR